VCKKGWKSENLSGLETKKRKEKLFHLNSFLDEIVFNLRAAN